MVVANPALPSGWNTNCGAGAAVTGSGGSALAPGDTSLNLSGAGIAIGATCSIKVNVTSDTPGTYTNILPANTVRTLQGVTNSAAASAPLNVQEISIAKAFNPTAFQSGGKSELTISLKNPSPEAYTSVSINDTLPVGLSLLDTPVASTDCGGTLTATAGTRLISLTGGTISAGTITTPGSCTIQAWVTSSTPATYTNVIPAGALSATTSTSQVIHNITAATANLTTYGTGLGVSGSKSFNPNSIQVGGTSRLTVNFRAPADTSLSNFAITDALPSGILVAATPNPTTSNCGSMTFSPSAGDTLLSATGGSVTAGGLCSIAVNVTSNQPGTYTNTISPANISDTENRNMGGNFSATLTVSGLTVSKSFDPISVNPDGVSTLTIKLTNTNYSQLDTVSLSDTLPGSTSAGVVIAPTPNASTTCTDGGATLTATAGSQSISLSGGIIPAQVGSVPGICTITVDVTGKGSDASYRNTIPVNAVSGKIHGTSTTVSNQQQATADLGISAIRIDVVKGFDPISVFGGSSSVLTVQLTNPNSVPLSGIAFTDDLPQTTDDTGGMSIANPAHASTGTCGGTITAVPGATSFSFSGGSLGTGATKSCSLTVDVTMDVDGNLINKIPAGAVTSTNGASNDQDASATLTNAAGVRAIKFFGPSRIQSGSGNSSTLTITLENTSNVPLTSLGLIDNMPTGLTIATPPDANQCGGTLSSTDTQLTLAGGSLAGLTSCTMEISVTAPSAGTYLNCLPAGTVTDNLGTSNQDDVCDTLTVYNPPSISKVFSPNPVVAGQATGLTFTITNPNTSTAMTGVAFSDDLPAGLTLASVPNASQCGGTVSSSATSISLADGVIAAGGSCTVTASVSAAAGSSALLSSLPAGALQTSNGSNASPANATLTVLPLLDTRPVLTQDFYPAAILPGGVTTLTLTLANPDDSAATLSASLVDNLPSGVVIASIPNAGTTCSGGSLTADAGAGSLTLSGATIPARVGSTSGSCTVTADVTAASAGSYVNNLAAGALQTSAGDNAVATNTTLTVIPAVAQLPPSLSQIFAQDTILAGDTTTLTLSLSNPNRDTANLSADLVDDLPTGLVIAATPSAGTTCGGSLTADAGSSSLTLSGGAIPAGSGSTPGACTVSVDVTAASTGSYLNELADGVLQTSFGNNTGTTSASLAVISLTDTAPVLSQGFAADTIAIDGTSTLTLTLSNPAIDPVANVSLADTLPTGLVIANPSNAATTCTGTLAADSGTASISLTGAAIPAQSGGVAGSCTVTVDVTAGASSYYENALAANALQSDAGDGAYASDATLTVLPDMSAAATLLAMGVHPALIAANGTSTLTITLANPNPTQADLTSDLVENLPARMLIASTPAASTTCTGSGSVGATPGGTSLTLPAGFSIPAGSGGTAGVCTVSVNVTAAIGGNYLNTTSNVTTSNSGTGNTASSILNVIAPPAIDKAFSPATINVGENSTLTFTLTNSNPATTLNGVSFSDAFPVGLQVAATPNPSTIGCGTPTFNPSAADTSLSFSGGSITAGNVCTVSVDVTGMGGIYDNTTGAVTSTNGGSGNTATAQLTISGAGLVLQKSTTNTGFQASGSIHYDYQLTNTGDITLYAPFLVTDDHIGTPTSTPFDCGVATSLDPGDSLTCSADYSVTAGDVTARSVTNSATASAMNASTGGTVVTSNESSVTVKLAELTLHKTTSTASYRSVGNTINYAYTLTNTGGVTLYAPFQVSDDHVGSPPGTAFTCGAAASLAPGANLTCTSSYTVTTDDVTAGAVTNTAHATALDAASSGNTVTSNDSSVTVNLVIAPVISKAFSGPDPIAVGRTTTLTFTIQNPSSNTVPLTGVGFSDTFPSGLVVAAAPDANQCGGTVSSTSGSISLSGGTILPDSSCTVTVDVTGTTSGLKDNTTGAVTSTNGGSGNTAEATITVVVPPTISKAFSPTAIAKNGLSTLTFTIVNPNAGEAITGVSFTDTFPSGMEVAAFPNDSMTNCGSPTFSPTGGDTSLSFSGGTLAAGVTCTISLDVTSTTGGAKSNTTGVITSSEGGNGSTSNTAVLNVDIAELTLAKSISAGDNFDTVGDTIDYDYLLTNTGTVTMIGNGTGGLFTVTDDKVSVTCPATPAGLAPSDSVTCTGTYTITQADLDAGQVVNHATAYGKYDTDLVTSNEDTQTATGVQTPKLTLVKTIDAGTPYKAAGDILTYHYALTNSGNVTLDGVAPDGTFTVHDDHLGAAFDCGTATSLAPGDSLSCTADYTVLQANVDAGYVTNTATANGQVTSLSQVVEAGQAVTSNDDSQTAYVYDLAIVKSNNVSDIAVLAKPFTWTITVSSVPTARGIFASGDTIVSDPLPSTATYGSTTVTPVANVGGTGTIACSILSNTLTCTASGGPVTLGTNLAAGSFTVAFSATPNTMAALSNTATVNPDNMSQEINTANNTSTNNLTVTAPDLIVSKTNNVSGDVLLGSSGVATFQWTLTVENQGDASATFTSGQKILTDTLPAAATYPTSVTVTPTGITGAGTISCSIASKVLTCTASGGDVTIPTGAVNFTAAFGVAPTSVGNLVNSTATVDPDHHVAESDETNNVAAQDTVTVRAPDLVVTKTNNVSGSVLLGLAGTPTFQWTVKETNQGTADATFSDGQTILTDTLPANATYGDPAAPVTSGVTGTVTCGISSGVLTCSASGAVTIASATGNFSVTFDVTPSKVGSLLNTATADPDNHILESNDLNNSGSNTVTVHAPDLKVTKTNDTGANEVLLGLTFKWSLKVNNTGDAAATFSDGQAILTDTLPANASYAAPTISASTGISGTGSISCAIVTNTLTCTASGGSVTLAASSGSFTTSFVVTPTATGNLVNNSVTVDPDSHIVESDESNNTASNTVKVTIADLTVSKDDGSSTYVPGSPTTYTIIVGNTGDGYVSGALVSDAIPSQVSSWTWTCSGASGGATGCNGVTDSTSDFSDTVNLPSGATITYTVVAKTKSSAITDLVNEADIATPTGVVENNSGDNTATDTDTAAPHATLTVNKTDGITKYVPGQTAPTYTITISNTGPSDATTATSHEATLTDAIPAQISEWTWACGTATGGASGCDGISNSTTDFSDVVSLPAGSSLIYTVTTATIASNQTANLVNKAMLDSQISPEVSKTDTDTPDPHADLWVTKDDTVSSYVPGQSVLTYTVTVGNDGPSDVSNAELTDSLPSQLDSWTWTCGTITGSAGGCDGGTATPFSDFVDLPAHSSISYTVTTPMVAADKVGNLANTASISVPSGVTDPGPKANSKTDTDTPDFSTDLAIDKSDSVTTFVPGDDSAPLVYTVTVTNAGPSKAVNAQVSDTFNASAYKSWTWECTTITGAANCNGVTNSTTDFSDAVDIDPGGSITYTVTALTKSSFRGTLTNTATVAVSGATGTEDPTPGNNSSSESDDAAPEVALSLTKTDGATVTTYTPGTDVTYSIVVSNAGPSDSFGAVVTDAKPPEITSWTWTCSPTGDATCHEAAENSADFSDTVDLPAGETITYTVVAKTNSALTSDLANTASVARGPGETESNTDDNSATDTDTAVAAATLSISKTDGTGAYTPGQSQPTYTITVSNAGPSDVTGAEVTDILPTQISSWTWTCVENDGANGCDNTGYSDSTANFDDLVNLPAGSSIVYTVTTPDKIASDQTGNLANTASVTATLSSDSSTDTDTFTPQAELWVTKTDGVTSYIPGQSQLTYTVTIGNDGPSDANNAVLDDAFPAQLDSWTWTCVEHDGASGCDHTGYSDSTADFQDYVNLPAGSSITYTVTSPTIASDKTGSLVNTATITPPAGVTDPGVKANTVTDSDSSASQADIVVTKTDGLDSYIPGTPLTYTVVVSNDGPSDAAAVDFSDPLPAQFDTWSWTCVASGATGCADGSGSSAISQTLAMPNGSSVTYTINATPRSNASGDLVNTASATASAPAGISDPDSTNNTDISDTDTANPTVALSVSKDDHSDSYAPGATVTYTIVVANAGPSDSVGAVVADAKPAQVTSWTWTCSEADGASDCDNTGYVNSSDDFNDTVSLPAGASITYTVAAKTDSSLTSELTNTVTVTRGTGEAETDTSNNSATDTDSAGSYAVLSVSKTDGLTSYIPGQTQLTYTVVLSNAGPSDVPAATLTDSKPAQLDSWSWACSDATGGASGCDAGTANSFTDTVNLPAGSSLTYTVTSPTIGADKGGNLVNTATLTSPISADATAEDSDAADPQADLVVTKTDTDGLSSYLPGQPLTYTLTVDNNGPSDAQDVQLSDPLPTDVSYISASGTGWTCGDTVNPDSSETVNCTLSSSLASGDETSVTLVVMVHPEFYGTLSNTATVSASTSDPDGSNNTSTSDVTIEQAPVISATKTATLIDQDGDGLIGPGDILEYTIAIHNAGSADAANVVFSDQPDEHTTLVAGSVSADTGGTVAVGNTSGDTTVEVDIPSITALGGDYTLTFQVQIESPLAAGLTQVSNQGQVSGDNFAPLTTDDPGTITPDDPTITPVGAPQIVATKSVMLSNDADHNGLINPGDSVLYTIHMTNSGTISALSLVVDDTPDPNTDLQAGTVTSDVGTILQGNTSGDSSVQIDLGDFDPSATATITYVVRIHDAPLPAGVTTIANQAVLSATNMIDGVTDDPGTSTPSDPTDTAISNPTAVTLLYFKATAQSNDTDILVTWATATEIDNVGFYLYRAPVNDFSQAEQLTYVPSEATGSENNGASYQYTDTPPGTGIWYYWLEDVDTHGVATPHSLYPISAILGEIPGDYHLYLPFVVR